MNIYEELIERGLIAQVTDEKEIKEFLEYIKRKINYHDQLFGEVKYFKNRTFE